MKTQKNPGAATRRNFIETFAFGDKSEAINSLISEALSSHRFDGVTSDDFIYEALAAGSLAAPLETEISQAFTA